MGFPQLVSGDPISFWLGDRLPSQPAGTVDCRPAINWFFLIGGPRHDDSHAGALLLVNRVATDVGENKSCWAVSRGLVDGGMPFRNNFPDARRSPPRI